LRDPESHLLFACCDYVSVDISPALGGLQPPVGHVPG